MNKRHLTQEEMQILSLEDEISTKDVPIKARQIYTILKNKHKKQGTKSL